MVAIAIALACWALVAWDAARRWFAHAAESRLASTDLAALHERLDDAERLLKKAIEESQAAFADMRGDMTAIQAGAGVPSYGRQRGPGFISMG